MEKYFKDNGKMEKDKGLAQLYPELKKLISNGKMMSHLRLKKLLN